MKLSNERVLLQLSVGAILTLTGLIGCTSVAETQDGVIAGTIEKVWEDGFRINTGDRLVTVDTWDVCGDNTAQNVSVGDRLTVTGEFDDGEFDAAGITDTNGAGVCVTAAQIQDAPTEPTTMASQRQPQGSAIAGTIEKVWEDGFRINTGDHRVTVDTWDVCGDNTAQNVSVGDTLTVTGEFDDGELDAAALTNANNERICSFAS